MGNKNREPLGITDEILLLYIFIYILYYMYMIRSGACFLLLILYHLYRNIYYDRGCEETKGNNTVTTKPNKKTQEKHLFLCEIFFVYLFTDLSVAGLPAELKHITQRRKRKQP